MESSGSSDINQWTIFGKEVPKSEIVFFCQVIVIYTVVVTSIYNLTRGVGDNDKLWTALLSSSLGYLLPCLLYTSDAADE